MRRHLFRSFVLFFLLGVSTLALDVRLAKTESVAIVVPDDFLTIQEAINSATDGDVVFVKTGTYYEHVVVNKTVSLVGENNDTTIIDGNGTGRVVDITRDNVNVTNFTVRKGGSNMFPDFEAGISLNNSKGCLIMSNNVDDNGCFGIHLLNSDQNTISGNNFTHNAMYAIDLTESNRNTISFNTATLNTNIAIGMHITSNNNIITGNTIINNTYGIDAANANNNTISNNYVADNSEIGIWIQDNANSNTIYGNTLTGCKLGIQILNSRYTEIYSNMIAHNYGSDEWDAGVRLDGAGYTQIHSNDVTDNSRGIVLYTSSPHATIFGNNVTNNNYGIRVAMGGSNYVNVSGNYVANNRGYGIDVTGFGGVGESNYATIARNLIVNNTFEAVGLGIGSSHNTVIQNSMIENGHAGITLERYSNYNTIVQNNIIRNVYGICFDLYIVNSTQNFILSNNIVSNAQQVRIASGSINLWNGSYALGGNYWSDYNGTDLSSGLYQNETGSDGIGDTAYVIDANNIDRFPLRGMFLDHEVTSECHVQTVCNSTLSDFQFNGTAIRFGVSGESGTAGFCRICIPTALMNETYRVFVDGTEVLANLLTCSNATHSYLYFSYTHSTQEVAIIPEFPANLVLILFMSSTMLLVACKTKKKLFQARACDSANILLVSRALCMQCKDAVNRKASTADLFV